MQIKFITANGYYQKGDIADLTPGLAHQCIREGKAEPYTAPREVTPGIRAMANWKTAETPQNRRLSQKEIRALYGMSFRNKAYSTSRPITISK